MIAERWRTRLDPRRAGLAGDVILFALVAAAYALGYIFRLEVVQRARPGRLVLPTCGGHAGDARPRAPRTVARCPRRRRDGRVALDLGRGTSVGGTAGLVLANLAEPLVGATLLLWLVGRVDLRRKRHLSVFLGAAVVAAPVVGAAIAATTFVYLLGGSGWLRFAFEWWAGDGLGGARRRRGAPVAPLPVATSRGVGR